MSKNIEENRLSEKVYSLAMTEIVMLFNNNIQHKNFKKLKHLVNCFYLNVSLYKTNVSKLSGEETPDGDFCCDLTGKIFIPEKIATIIMRLQEKTSKKPHEDDTEGQVEFMKSTEALLQFIDLYKFEEDETVRERFHFIGRKNNCLHWAAFEALKDFIASNMNNAENAAKTKYLLQDVIVENLRRKKAAKRNEIVKSLAKK